MPPVLPEHQSITTRGHAHGQGREGGNQVRSRWEQIACGAEYWQK